jgi:dihydroorotate dehydrogenase
MEGGQAARFPADMRIMSTSRLASNMMPVLRLLDAERAHGVALRALALGLAGADLVSDDPRLGVTVFGRDFVNPIGLSAGFDKNAAAIGPLSRLGFGFIEVGTVTPLPQIGNPRPRIFRLPEDRAIINRLGFNNQGLDVFLRRLSDRPRGALPIGANIGINKDGAVPERDYPALVAALASHADYITLNVSSPNTPGLRDLQAEGRLRSILVAITQAVPRRPPLLVKLAPDLSEDGLATVVETCVAEGVAGLIVSNTTISRPRGLRSAASTQPGGLSGAPLRALSTRMLARAAYLARGRLALIGVGGVASGADVLTKLRAGASLVQLDTEFAYEGPALIPRLKRELLRALDAAGYADVTAAVGTGIEELMWST